MTWEFVPVLPGRNSIPNLHICRRFPGAEVRGFIEKPRDTRTDKNFWRCFVGVGESVRFIGHARKKNAAMVRVECETFRIA